MRSVIVDTGPLVALLNHRDRRHEWARDVLDTIEPPLLTCESVLSEACFLLQRVPGGTKAVLELVDRGVLEIRFALAEDWSTVRRMMDKYADVPMSLADACLTRMAEIHRHGRLLTFDEGFLVYRINRRQHIPVLMPQG
ncbi:MAG: type II toxin-antitoxin system VapC family toxin [Planctomycetaceae bacterium]